MFQDMCQYKLLIANKGAVACKLLILCCLQIIRELFKPVKIYWNDEIKSYKNSCFHVFLANILRKAACQA